jgi:DNA polymerase II small subunit
MKSILKLFSEHGTFVQPDTLEYILSRDNPEGFTSLIIKNLKEYPLILTTEQVQQIEQHQKEKLTVPSVSDREKKQQLELLPMLYTPILKHNTPDDFDEENFDRMDDEDSTDTSDQELDDIVLPSVVEIKKITGWNPPAKQFDPEIRILKDVTGKSTCEGTALDFSKLFMNRYEVLRKILRNQRRELANVVPINKIKKSVVKEIQIVGIIKDVRTTRNGHRLIELEDETGTVNTIALNNNRVVSQMASEVVLDEIIGITGQLSKQGDLLVVQSIVFPDISIQNKRHKSETSVCAAFLSDIHMGSKKFMKDEWHSFLKWINGGLGNSRQRDVAGRIKYLIIPGDVVDGIGIYPTQEKELAITDLYRQYEALAEQFELLPDHISIIMQPGNHDAVRPAEPQPTFEKEIQDLFSAKDITFVGNPCYFSLHGVEILSYHGQSLLDFATNIQQLKYNEPVETMKIMLKKHHLAPTYGGYTPLAPEHLDYMIIDKVPDIFVTGHVHLATIGDYRGVTLINASSWQAQTSYQKMLNFVPDSAKLPIADLKTGNVTMMDFSKQFS